MNADQRLRSITRASALMIARSVLSNRGWGTCRCRTASCWRRTRISASFERSRRSAAPEGRRSSGRGDTRRETRHDPRGLPLPPTQRRRPVTSEDAFPAPTRSDDTSTTANNQLTRHFRRDLLLVTRSEDGTPAANRAPKHFRHTQASHRQHRHPSGEPASQTERRRLSHRPARSRPVSDHLTLTKNAVGMRPHARLLWRGVRFEHSEHTG